MSYLLDCFALFFTPSYLGRRGVWEFGWALLHLKILLCDFTLGTVVSLNLFVPFLLSTFHENMPK